MNIDQYKPQHACTIFDDKFGKLGYLVIDRTIGNMSIGGIRCGEDVTADEVATLARSMTLKCSFLNFKMGGAKAGISAPSSLMSKNRDDVLAAFGRALRPLLQRGVYITGQDIGISAQDLNIVKSAAGLAIHQGESMGYHDTASTIFETIKQAAQIKKLPFSGARVAIEGLGGVGAQLAEFLSYAGADIVAVSTKSGAVYNEKGISVSEIAAKRDQFGDDFVNRSMKASRIQLPELLLLDVDLLIPCARPWTITESNVKKLKAKIIIPGSNAPVTPEAEKILHEMDILYLPGFVANGGAILAGAMRFRGFTNAEITQLIQNEFAVRVRDVLNRAGKKEIPANVARQIAWRNYKNTTKELADRIEFSNPIKWIQNEGLKNFIPKAGSRVYKRGLLKTEMFRKFALAEFKKQVSAENVV